jgi:hypothetical protein
MSGEIALRTRPFRRGEEGAEVVKMPTEHLVKILLDQAHARLLFDPPTGVTEMPVFTKTGRLIDTPGYDRESDLYYHPLEGVSIPAVPAVPSNEDVARAAGLLRGVTCLCSPGRVSPGTE